jgi:hypothetical protein
LEKHSKNWEATQTVSEAIEGNSVAWILLWGPFEGSINIAIKRHLSLRKQFAFGYQQQRNQKDRIQIENNQFKKKD